MKRFLAMVGALITVSVAFADVAPNPGFKRVPLEHKVSIEKDAPDYVFFSVSGLGDAKPVKLDAKNPATLKASGGGPGRAVYLVAVPKDAGKKFDNEKDFHAAVGKGKIDGMIRAKTSFWAFNDIKESDPRKVIVVEYKIEKIDPKEGIVYDKDKPSAKVDPSKSPANPAPVKDGEDDSDGIVYTPKGGTWVAGLAATFALVMGGLWIARRRRPLA